MWRTILHGSMLCYGVVGQPPETDSIREKMQSQDKTRLVRALRALLFQGSQLSHDNPHDNPQHRASGRQDGTAGWAGKCPGSDASIRNGTRLHQLAHDTRHVQSPGPKGSRDLFTLDLLKLCLPFRPVKIPRRCTRLI
ncbi:uncharacterized protein B0T23DRAFT_216754 [Neurospora hispaniola]|uniref:Uncharacterized protein n=1 Tax=Neurospora hispaniola TaxID=588809 RepID=A0AAJ0I1Z3_9PEZI|nr:hypothetical protein B0T23DRAFT_216754 [Neurospora hispaniola]